jgi:tetratricopeptide (TPR) repeat protein/ribosome-binding protein aMBF1 (putative translation factor)
MALRVDPHANYQRVKMDADQKVRLSGGKVMNRLGEAQMTFGVAFGALIREKRGQEGLTQKELAVSAFNDETKVRRIIDLENGDVARPHAKTVDPLVVCLGITREELAVCSSAGRFSEKERSVLGLSRELLENLSTRFEHDNPDAPDEELIGFLKGKAVELRDIRERLAKLEQESSSAPNQIAAANAAIEAGHFQDADDILANAEEVEIEQRTMAQVATQSDLRSARGDNALLQDNYTLAASHYRVSAEYFLGFDKIAAAARLLEYAGRIYETARRSMNPTFDAAIGLADQALPLVSLASDRDFWIDAAYSVALLRQTEARRGVAGSIDLLSSAIQLCKVALENSQDPDAEFNWARCTFLLANCYLARAEAPGNENWRSDVDSAIEGYELYLRRPVTETVASHRCGIYNSLSSAYRFKAHRCPNEQSDEATDKAKRALLRAIELSSQQNQIHIWGAAQYNLGAMLAQESNRATPSELERAMFLGTQAIASFLAAIESFPATGFATQMGDASLSLGKFLVEHSFRLPPEFGEAYLARAIHHLEVSMAIFARERFPRKWAEANFYLGATFLGHFQYLSDHAARSDLDSAKKFLSAALSVFEQNDLADVKAYRDRCAEMLITVDEGLSKLSEA